MAQYSTGSLIKTLRERTEYNHEAMLVFSKLDESSLRRIETEKQHPKTETLESLMRAIEFPLKGFIYSKLENQPMRVNILCDRLTQALDIGDAVMGEKILTELESMTGFDEDLLMQFILSKKAQLWDLQGKPPKIIMPLIEQGLIFTFKKFDISSLNNMVLILEESELLHTKARICAKSGDTATAVKILEQMVSNLSKLPEADKDKERQFAPIIFSLAKLFLETGRYAKAVKLCDLGADYSAKRMRGQLNPDFAFMKARALLTLKRKNECKTFLQQAYFGYILLGNVAKAEEVLKAAKNDFVISFELYGVGGLDFSHHVRMPYSRGEAIDCNSFGTMVRALRKKAKLSIRKLCEGICADPTLYRLETDNAEVSFFTIEAIMQRLGRSVDLYKDFFLSRDEFVAMQLRDKINMQLIELRYYEASRSIVEFEKLKLVKKNNVLKQFLHMAKAILFNSLQPEPNPDYSAMLLDALKITYPKFNERDIETYHLSYNEIGLINQYGGYLVETGELERAADIFQKLRQNLDMHVVDEVEKARAFATVMFNYSSTLGRSERRRENQQAIEEGESFERGRGRLTELPGFAFNKGYNLLKLGKKEECIPYLVMAYYGTKLFASHGQESYLDIIRETVKTNLDINLD